MKNLFLVFALCISGFVNASNYYWVGGNGNWSDYANHWATTSGGNVFHSQAPTSFDDVFFDLNSFTITDDTVFLDNTISYCKNFNDSVSPFLLCVFYASTPNNSLYIFGSAFVSNYTHFYWVEIRMKATTPGNIFDFRSPLQLPNIANLAFDGIGGTWDVRHSIVSDNLNLINGTINTNGYDINISGIYLNDSINLSTSVVTSADFRSLKYIDADSAEIYITRTGTGGCSISPSVPIPKINKIVSAEITNISTSAGSGNIYVGLIKSNLPIINGPAADSIFIDTLEYNDSTSEFWLSDQAMTGHVTHIDYLKLGSYTRIICNSGNSTSIQVDSVTSDCPSAILVLEYSGDTFFDKFMINNPDFALTIGSQDSLTIGQEFRINSMPGYYTNIVGGKLKKASGEICIDYTSIQNNIAAGGADFYDGNNFIDSGGNSGWNWSACAVGINEASINGAITLSPNPFHTTTTLTINSTFNIICL